jgi:hypothetical protein
MSLGASRVINSITDLSMFVDQILLGWVVMVLQTERGPVGTATAVATWDEFRANFGNKVAWTNDPLVAEMALRQGARLIVIRIVHYTDVEDVTTITALKSSVELLDRGATATRGVITAAAGPYTFVPAAAGSVTGTEVGPFNFATDVNDAFKITVGSEAAETVTFDAGTFVSCDDVCAAINAGTTGLTAENVDEKVKLTANTITSSLTIGAVTADAYSTLGFVEAVSAAVTGTNKLVISVNGTTDQTFMFTPAAGESGSFSLTSGQCVTQLATLAAAVPYSVSGCLRILTLVTGSSATLQIQSTSTCETPLGVDNSIYTGSTGVTQPTLKVEARHPGLFGDDILCQIWPSALLNDTRFNLKVVYSRQGITETYTDMSMDTTSDHYVVNYINQRPSLIWLTDLESSSTAPTNRPIENTTGTALTGGSDGGSLTESDYIGNSMAQTGFYAADQTWNPAMDIMIPGTQSATVYQALILYVEQRADMIAYGEIPANMTPAEALNWRHGIGYGFGAWNSHRFCLFFGRPLVYDDMDGTRKYVSSLGHLASCLCLTDNKYNQSYAPVGPKRGRVTLCEGVDYDVRGYSSTGYADLFAENGINYLFISRIKGIEGSMFWEQRTTWLNSSALRNLNVVRFITAANRMILPILETFLFDPNHPMTWREIHRVLEPAFQDFKNRYQIYDFLIQTDRDAYWNGKGELLNAVINTGLDISRGIYHCRALIQPTQVIYYLMFNMGVVGAGEAFEQFTDLYQLPGWNVA